MKVEAVGLIVALGSGIGASISTPDVGLPLVMIFAAFNAVYVTLLVTLGAAFIGLVRDSARQ